MLFYIFIQSSSHLVYIVYKWPRPPNLLNWINKFLIYLQTNNNVSVDQMAIHPWLHENHSKIIISSNIKLPTIRVMIVYRFTSLLIIKCQMASRITGYQMLAQKILLHPVVYIILVYRLLLLCSMLYRMQYVC